MDFAYSHKDELRPPPNDDQIEQSRVSLDSPREDESNGANFVMNGQELSELCANVDATNVDTVSKYRPPALGGTNVERQNVCQGEVGQHTQAIVERHSQLCLPWH